MPNAEGGEGLTTLTALSSPDVIPTHMALPFIITATTSGCSVATNWPVTVPRHLPVAGSER